MSDRYTTTTREVPVDPPRNTAYPTTGAATGDLNSQHRVSLHPAGFRVRERGALEGTVVHAYRCPVHGLVDVRVPRGDVPDEVPCVAVYGRVDQGGKQCALASTWAGSQCGQGWAAGECKS